jgi:hypothetical protein
VWPGVCVCAASERANKRVCVCVHVCVSVYVMCSQHHAAPHTHTHTHTSAAHNTTPHLPPTHTHPGTPRVTHTRARTPPDAQGGCIIRAGFLDRIKQAYQRDAGLPNLLMDPAFAKDLASRDAAWRRVVGLAVAHGVPAPGMTASLGYFDTYRRERLPANLVQVRAWVCVCVCVCVCALGWLHGTHVACACVCVWGGGLEHAPARAAAGPPVVPGWRCSCCACVGVFARPAAASVVPAAHICSAGVCADTSSENAHDPCATSTPLHTCRRSATSLAHTRTSAPTRRAGSTRCALGPGVVCECVRACVSTSPSFVLCVPPT